MAENQILIAEKIANGTYILSNRRKGSSFIWKIISEIIKDDETLVKGYVYCRTCQKVLKFNKNQSSNLNRHKCCLALKQPQILKKVTTIDKQTAIDACTSWVVEDCRPLSAFNGPGFVKLANFFIKIGATYGDNVDVIDLLPDPTTISRKLEKSAHEKKIELKSEINNVINSGHASATIVMWSDDFVKKNFLGVTMRYQKDDQLFDIVMGMKSMDFERSTGDDILKKLKSLFSEFGVQNLEPIKFVTDRGKNIVKALEHNIRLNCSSHLLANVLDKSFDETLELSDILESCKKIVKDFNKANPQHKLIAALESQCANRWNSNYAMFKSIVDNSLRINEVLTEDEETQHLLHINIKTLIIVVELCKDFEIIFKKLQLCSSPSLCFVLPSIYKIKSLCVPDNTDIRAIFNLKANILKNIDKIWLKNLSLWHKVAFFLYPPAVNMQQSDLNDIKDFCISRIQTFENGSTKSSDPASISIASTVASSSSADADNLSLSPISSSSGKEDIQFFFADLLKESSLTVPKTPRQEIERYSKEVVKITEDFDLMDWWKINAVKYPHLSNFAIQVHAIPASSAAAERAFSLAGNIITEERNRLGPKTVDDLLFYHSLYKNLKK